MKQNKLDNNKITSMVEKLYQIIEKEELTINEGWEVAHHLKLKMEKAKELVCYKLLSEIN